VSGGPPWIVSPSRAACLPGVLSSDMHSESAAEPRVEYAAMLLGATGNVGGRILHLLAQSPLCRKVVVVTRRNVAELANPKVQQVVVNMDTLEAELAPHARGVDIAFAAFGVGKGSAKTPRSRTPVAVWLLSMKNQTWGGRLRLVSDPVETKFFRRRRAGSRARVRRRSATCRSAPTAPPLRRAGA
jgi:hypothetical protein